MDPIYKTNKIIKKHNNKCNNRHKYIVHNRDYPKN